VASVELRVRILTVIYNNDLEIPFNCLPLKMPETFLQNLWTPVCGDDNADSWHHCQCSNHSVIS